MRRFFSIFLIFLICKQALTAESPTLPLEKANPKISYMASCNILDSNFNFVKAVSGEWLCMALPDGGWISSNNVNRLSRWDGDGTLVWSRKGFYHHQITPLESEWLLTFIEEAKTVKKKRIAFSKVQKIRISDGKIINEYSIYDGIYKSHELAGTALDKEPMHQATNVQFFKTDLEKSHLNSVMYKDHFVFVNEWQMVGFILDENLKFVKYIEYPDSLTHDSSLISHDLHSLGDDTYLFFKNYNEDQQTKRSTFKIYEFKNKKITFEFPMKSEDFVHSDYSGGVDKTKEGYVVGFPNTESLQTESTVGLISLDGHWILKKSFPYRIQDIKKIPFENYLKLNRVH